MQKGCLSQVSTAASSTSFDLYDPFCKVRQSTQTTAGQSYGFQYTYDRAGNLKTLTYPSGRVVTTSYDDAGRPVQMTGLRAGASTTYVSGAQYAAHGALMLLQLGNGVTESTGYNNRLQMQTRTAGLPGITLLGLSYGYAVGANNGNVQSQTISHSQIGVSGQADFEAALNVTQNYTYSDGANRLTSMAEGGSSRSYGYDSRGNRWVA
ncbi:MAG: RHS repeat protein [Acidobacteria bacterium]|nr:RHS repeat protein [Acidobacteriota bacterium]